MNYNLKLILSFLYSLLAFLVIAETLLIWPQAFYYLLGALNVVFLITFLFAFKKDFYKYFSLFFLVANSILLYISLIANYYFIQILILLGVIFLVFYLIFLYQKAWFKLKTFSFYFSLVGLFFISAFLLNLQIFINIAFWKILILWLGAIIITVFSSLVFSGFKKENIRLFTFINSALIFQIAIVLYFLPLEYDMLALILAILYYCLEGLTQLFLSAKLKTQAIKNYTILTLLGLLFILLGSKWM